MCSDPHCSHMTHIDNIRGKASMCAVCGKNEIVLNYYELKLAKPSCMNCRNTNEAIQGREKKKVLDDVFGGLYNND